MDNDTAVNPSTELLQLKKNNFLAALTEEPMTKEQLINSLDGFDFLGSWLDFLIEHFTAQGKLVVVENDDGEATYARKAGKGAAGPKEVFLVEFDEDGGEDEQGAYIITKRTLAAGEVMDKAAGEGATANSAVKHATSKVFAQYKTDTATIRELLNVEEDESKD